MSTLSQFYTVICTGIYMDQSCNDVQGVQGARVYVCSGALIIECSQDVVRATPCSIVSGIFAGIIRVCV